MQRKFCQQIYLLFLSCHYGFTDYFELVNFAFLKSYPEEFHAVKYYPSSVSTSWNMNFLKSCIFTFNLHFQSFQSDLANFLKSDLSSNPYKIMSWNFQDYHIFLKQYCNKLANSYQILRCFMCKPQKFCTIW